MTTPTTDAAGRAPALLGQTVVVIGGSSGIGLETARQARAEGAELVLAGLNRGPVEKAAAELEAKQTAAFDATDSDALKGFFADLPVPVDHVMVTGPGPYYAPLADLDRDRAHRDFDNHLWLAVEVARNSVGRVRAGGTRSGRNTGSGCRGRPRLRGFTGCGPGCARLAPPARRAPGRSR
jgi:NAD(P)-dependent dehydrogenase (short-subunit alcohol dehydrogenase family)